MFWIVFLALFIGVVAYAAANSAAISKQRIRTAWTQVDAQADHLRQVLKRVEPDSDVLPEKPKTISEVVDLEAIGQQLLRNHREDEYSGELDMALNRLHFAQNYYNEIAGFFNRRFNRLPWVVFKGSKEYRPRPLFQEIPQQADEADKLSV